MQTSRLILALLCSAVSSQLCPSNLAAQSWENITFCTLSNPLLLVNASVNFRGAVLDCGGGPGLQAQGIVNLQNFTLRNCLAAFGGALRLLSGSLTVHDATFLNSRASGYGGAIAALNGSIACVDCFFCNCTAADLGGAIGAAGVSHVTLLRSRFSDCSSIGGGAVLGLTVVGNFSQFFNCSAAGGYGGAAIRANIVTLTNCSFDKMHAESGLGGAINSWVTVATGCRFSDCLGRQGGAVYASWVHLVACSFRYCNAELGGALRFYTGTSSPSTVEPYAYGSSIERCSFSNCVALEGGAINAADFELTDCSFSDCNATARGGGIVALNALIRRTNFTRCLAQEGGALLATHLDAVELELIACYAVEKGGAMSVSTGNISATVFRNCWSAIGGSLLSTTAVLSNCSFFNSSAVSGDGGAISTTSLLATGCMFEHCSASLTGGALLANQFSIDNSTFRSCTAGLQGGGVASLPVLALTRSFLNCSRFESLVGGAVLIYNLNTTGLSLALYGCIFKDNAAVPSGGSIIHAHNVSVSLEAWSSSNNGEPQFYGSQPTGQPQLEPDVVLACSPLESLIRSSSMSTSGLTTVPSTNQPNSTASTISTTRAEQSTVRVPEFNLVEGYELTAGAGTVSLPGTVVFSGTLTVHVDGLGLASGDELTLFSFASASGHFDELVLSASGCRLTGRLEYHPSDVLLVIDSNTCLSTSGARAAILL